MSAEPPHEPATNPTGAPMFSIEPFDSQHEAHSRRGILTAAAEVAPGRTLVLGAGACEEIPLAELALRFAHVTLNDTDAAGLERALAAANLEGELAGKIELHVADLTGATAPLLSQFEQILAEAHEPGAAIEPLARAAEAQAVSGVGLAGKYDLLVASCLLSQLHVELTQRAGELFERRFAGQGELLRESKRWFAAIEKLARRMEDRLIAELRALVTDEGLVFLSESVHVCYIELTAAGSWESAGSYRMLRSKDLAEYVTGAFRVVARQRWEWVVLRPSQVAQVGRLYDVQALVLAPQ